MNNLKTKKVILVTNLRILKNDIEFGVSSNMWSLKLNQMKIITNNNFILLLDIESLILKIIKSVEIFGKIKKLSISFMLLNHSTLP